MTAKEAARAIYDATTALNAGEITVEECRLHMAYLKQGFTEDEWENVKWRWVLATA